MEVSVVKATSAKLSTLIWKIRQFKGQFQRLRHRLQSHFPNKRHLSMKLVSRKGPKTTLRNKQGPTTTNPAVPDLEHYPQSGSLLPCKKRKKTAKLRENTSNFKTTSLPCNLTSLPQMHPRQQPCVGATTPHPARHNTPSVSLKASRLQADYALKNAYNELDST